MSRLRQESSALPKVGVVLSVLAASAVMTFIVVVADDLPTPGRIALGLALGLLLLVYGLLVSYVYGDSRRRGMRHILWTLVAAFVPNALGFIAYFILREPLLQPCATCGATARRDFAFCPACGSPLPRTCPSCRRPVELVWSHCAHCGQKLASEGGTAALTAEIAPESSSPDEATPFQEG